jgi:hypothetical protein
MVLKSTLVVAVLVDDDVKGALASQKAEIAL